MKDARTPHGYSVWNSLWLGGACSCETPAWHWSHLPLLPLCEAALIYNLLLEGRVLQSLSSIYHFKYQTLGVPLLEHRGWGAPWAHFRDVMLCGVPRWYMLASHPWGYQA